MPAQASNPLRRFAVIFRDALLNFARHECALRAASLAYFAMFSVFPLLLFIIFLGSNVLHSPEVRQALTVYLEQALPVGSQNIRLVIDQTLRSRGSIGLLGGLTLFWGASSMFGVLESALNVIWGSSPRGYLRRRLISAITVLSLSALFIAALSIGPLVSWLWDGSDLLWKRWLNIGLSLSLTTIICFLLYRVFPNRPVPWRPALIGAAVVGVLGEGAKFLFGNYLRFAFDNYGYTYGSLAWLVALALWAYFIGVILFFGAEVGAAIVKDPPATSST